MIRVQKIGINTAKKTYKLKKVHQISSVDKVVMIWRGRKKNKNPNKTKCINRRKICNPPTPQQTKLSATSRRTKGKTESEPNNIPHMKPNTRTSCNKQPLRKMLYLS